MSVLGLQKKEGRQVWSRRLLEGVWHKPLAPWRHRGGGDCTVVQQHGKQEGGWVWVDGDTRGRVNGESWVCGGYSQSDETCTLEPEVGGNQSLLELSRAQ